MPVDFFLDPATIELPEIKPLRAFKWQHLPLNIAHAVAQEEQYLTFHLTLLDRLRFTQEGCAHNPPWSRPLGLSVRAGAIKAAVLITSSIAEAVLRAIAESRGYNLPANPNHRTMGKVLGAWQLDDERPRADIEMIWGTLQALHNIRNNIHLFKAATDPQAEFESILAQEEGLIPQLMPTLDTLCKLAGQDEPAH